MHHSSAGSAAHFEGHAHVLRLVYGAQVAQIIYVATQLGVPDLLAAGSRTASELATATAVDEPTLRRVLRGLVALGLCNKLEPDAYILSDYGMAQAVGAYALAPSSSTSSRPLSWLLTEWFPQLPQSASSSVPLGSVALGSKAGATA